MTAQKHSQNNQQTELSGYFLIPEVILSEWVSNWPQYSISFCNFVFILLYYMASSASRQDEPNRLLWLATRAGLPAVSRKQNFPQSHIINPLLTKFVRSRWLDIGLVFFLRVYGPSHLDLTSWPHFTAIRYCLRSFKQPIKYNKLVCREKSCATSENMFLRKLVFTLKIWRTLYSKHWKTIISLMHCYILIGSVVCIVFLPVDQNGNFF